MIILLEFERKKNWVGELQMSEAAGRRRMEKKREIHAFLSSVKASMFSIGIAWHWGIGDVRDSENVYRGSVNILQTMSGSVSLEEIPQGVGPQAYGPLEAIS